MKHLKFILLILLLSLVVILVFQNSKAVSETVQFRMNPVFFNEVQTPPIAVGLVMLMAFFLGVVFVGLFGMVERFHLRRQLKVLSRTLKEKDTELNSLRNLPITSDDVSPGQVNGTVQVLPSA